MDIKELFPKDREVLLPQRTIYILKAWRQETSFPEEESLIFYGENPTKTLNKSTVSKQFRHILNDKGFDLKNRNPVFHSLRHTYNTRMRNVLSEEMLQYMIGHKSKVMTERCNQAKPEERLREFLPKAILLRILQSRPFLSAYRLAKFAYLFDLTYVHFLGEQKTDFPYKWHC